MWQSRLLNTRGPRAFKAWLVTYLNDSPLQERSWQAGSEER